MSNQGKASSSRRPGNGEGPSAKQGKSAARETLDFRKKAPSRKHQRERTPMRLTRPVFFVGFMGAGKTSVSRYLARTCGIASVDMDTYLERREGKRVKEIFAEVGEEGFRSIETDVLKELAAKPEALLVSCGGGVVTRAENRAILAEHGTVVFLRVDVDEAASRISDKSTRPLFQDLEAARRRCAERQPLYEEVADVIVDTAGKSVSAIAHEVRRLLEKEGVLCRQPR